MNGERPLLRLGEFLVRRACQRLPREARQERYREWVAELPAILHDPQVRPAPRRAVRMLAYAADTLRGTAMTPPVRGRHRAARESAKLDLFLAVGLVLVAWNIWDIMQAPGYALNYLQLTWSLLLVAYSLSMLVRSAGRVTVLISIGSPLAGVVISIWNAAQAPGDWVNYLWAAFLFLCALAIWLADRWARGGHTGSAGSQRVSG
jgi:hypothetical protein